MDHTDNQLRACIKALDDVVRPSLSAGDAQAAEQLFLVTDYLRFLRTRLDGLHDRHRFEVRHHLALAEAILDDAHQISTPAAQQLEGAIRAGRGLLDRPDAGTAALRDGAGALAAAVTAVLRAVGTGASDAGARIEGRVIALSDEKIAVDRAWHLPQGLDGQPTSAPALGQVLPSG